MRFALAQINTTVGDLEGNVERILDAVRRAGDADLVAFPEMAVPGYPPRDILYDPSFVEATQAATLDLAQRARGLPPLLVGSFRPSGETRYQHPALHNVAWLMQDREMRLAAVKRLLPVYSITLENLSQPRRFCSATLMSPFGCGKVPSMGMNSALRCLLRAALVSARGSLAAAAGHRRDEGGGVDLRRFVGRGLSRPPGAELKGMGAQVLLCLAASPYQRGVGQERLYHVKRQGLPVAFVNLVGGNDELIFDGGSFWLEGERVEAAGRFEEKIHFVDTRSPTPPDAGAAIPKSGDFGVRFEEGELFDALVLGVRDFARKNGMRHAALGLSGGIDSSVAAAIAAEALGARNVTGVAIPSRYTDPRSTECARELAKTLGLRFEVVEMEAVHRSVEEALGGLLQGTAAENVQARIRMLILMSFVNREGGFLINTSNKTELALGYGTLYGDLAGTLSPLGDLTKPEVYALAKWINVKQDIIPLYALERPPSAELRPNQVDPFDYETLAPELERLVQSNQSNAAMRAAEHKRWQFGIALKVSAKAFGSGRMAPVTRR